MCLISLCLNNSFMRIAMILPSLAKTGPGFVVKDLCTEFVGMGHECKVFYFDEGEGLEMPCPTECIKFRKPFDFDNWDIIHSHMFRPDAYVWYHRRKIRKSGAKTVSTLHNPISYKAARTGFSIPASLMLSALWRLFFNAHDQLVVLNQSTQSELPKSLKYKSSIIFNGRSQSVNEHFDSTALSKVELMKKRHKIIGYVGSLTKRKGCNQMIEALKRLDGYILLLVGEGPEKKALENQAMAVGVYNRCLFIGFQEVPSAFIKLMDVFVMCSSSEGFPLALIESAYSGCPAVLSDIPILKSIISANDGVEFYKLNDIDDLIAKINYVYNNRNRMSVAISNFYQTNLTPDIMANKYLAYYRLE